MLRKYIFLLLFFTKMTVTGVDASSDVLRVIPIHHTGSFFESVFHERIVISTESNLESFKKYDDDQETPVTLDECCLEKIQKQDWFGLWDILSKESLYKIKEIIFGLTDFFQ